MYVKVVVACTWSLGPISGTNRPVPLLQTSNQTYQSQGPSQSQPHPPPQQQQPHPSKPQKQDKFSGLFGKLEEFGNEVAQKLGTALDPQAYAEYGAPKPQTENRFGSFASPRQGNEVKWHVDGCAYFYAVSKALESAKEYIWILDCRYPRDRRVGGYEANKVFQGGFLRNFT